MRFEKLDLNLLVAFDALIEERSVSNAALRLALSQSALSGALGRLREYFGDELLVQVGRTMVPTAMGSELAGPVRAALNLIRSTITTPIDFDPLVTERTFALVASDYVYDVLLANLLRKLAEEAPCVKFDISMPHRTTGERFERGEIDLFITVQDYLAEDHPMRFLFADDLAVIAEQAGAPLEMSLDEFQSRPHVDVTFGEERKPSFWQRVLQDLHVERRVELRVQTYTALPPAVTGTRRIAVMNRRHAEYFAGMFPLSVFPLPLSTPRLREAMQWHSMRRNDQGLLWLKERLLAAVKTLPGNDSTEVTDSPSSTAT